MNTQNIEIGAGSMTLQYDTDEAPVDIGGCRNASMEVKTTDYDVEVDQALDAVDNFDVKREIIFSIDMVEDTMRNFVISCGGNPDDIDDGETVPGSEIYEFPAASVVASVFAELIYTVARVKDKNKSKQYILYKVKNMGGVNFKFEKAKEKVYSVKFKAYASEDHGNKPGKVIYEKLAA